MKFLESKEEFIHSWYLFIMTILSLVFLMISKVFITNVMIALFILYLFCKNGLERRTLFKILFYSLFFSSVFLLLNIFYPAAKFRNGEVLIQLGAFTFYKASVIEGLKTFFRLFVVSFISMSSTFAINYTKMILYLVIHKGLSVFMGYPILIALNSILLFKEEFDRIRLSARFRDLGFWDRVFVIFPLLVFAIRHSQRGSLALVTRGLNPNKNFYFGYELVSSDRLWLFKFFMIYVTVVAIAIYFR